MSYSHSFLSCIVLMPQEAGEKESDILVLDFLQCLFCIERRPVWRNEFLSLVVGNVLVAGENSRSQVFVSNRQFILSGSSIWMHISLRYTELTFMLIIEVVLDVRVVVQFTAQYFETVSNKVGKAPCTRMSNLLFWEAPRSALLVCSFSHISLTVHSHTCLSALVFQPEHA